MVNLAVTTYCPPIIWRQKIPQSHLGFLEKHERIYFWARVTLALKLKKKKNNWWRFWGDRETLHHEEGANNLENASISVQNELLDTTWIGGPEWALYLLSPHLFVLFWCSFPSIPTTLLQHILPLAGSCVFLWPIALSTTGPAWPYPNSCGSFCFDSWEPHYLFSYSLTAYFLDPTPIFQFFLWKTLKYR